MRGGGESARARSGATSTTIATSKAATRADKRNDARGARSAVLTNDETSSFFMRAPDIVEARRSSRHRRRAYNARGALVVAIGTTFALLWSCGSRTELWMNDP